MSPFYTLILLSLVASLSGQAVNRRSCTSSLGCPSNSFCSSGQCRCHLGFLLSSPESCTPFQCTLTSNSTSNSLSSCSATFGPNTFCSPVGAIANATVGVCQCKFGFTNEGYYCRLNPLIVIFTIFLWSFLLIAILAYCRVSVYCTTSPKRTDCEKAHPNADDDLPPSYEELFE